MNSRSYRLALVTLPTQAVPQLLGNIRLNKRGLRQEVGCLASKTAPQHQSTIHPEVTYAISSESEHPCRGGNAAAKAGKLGSTIQSILADLKPEAVYFFSDKGLDVCGKFLSLDFNSRWYPSKNIAE